MVNNLLPNAEHSFCVFHQLKNLTKKYLDVFKKPEAIPKSDKEIYRLSQRLILANNAVDSTVILRKILGLSSKNLSKVSKDVVKYMVEIYHKNRKMLEKGFA